MVCSLSKANGAFVKSFFGSTTTLMSERVRMSALEFSLADVIPSKFFCSLIFFSAFTESIFRLILSYYSGREEFHVFFDHEYGKRPFKTRYVCFYCDEIVRWRRLNMTFQIFQTQNEATYLKTLNRAFNQIRPVANAWEIVYLNIERCTLSFSFIIWYPLINVQWYFKKAN